jgi:hypothetical protein
MEESTDSQELPSENNQQGVPDKSTPELVHDNMVQNIVSGLYSAIKANR